MEEHNYRHEEFDDCFLCKHPALRHFLAGLLMFLGAFAAFYVVSDWHFKRMLDPVYQMRRMDRDIMRQEKRMDKMVKKAMIPSAQFFHIEKTPDAYKIIIDLVSFDNNEKNVEIRTEGHTLIINAAGEKTSRHKQEIVKFSQAFAFGDDVDMSGITKVREGNHYIISVPFD